MPLVPDCPQTAAIGLEEFVDRMHAAKIDTTDEASMLVAAPWLKELANNRTFLADRAARELKTPHTMQANNVYGSQVFVLEARTARAGNFFMRACFWPSAHDRILEATGNGYFSYEQPHDHNFNFLTVGYLGPGYWSNYYEVDPAAITGFEGESVDLRFVGKQNLGPGKVMLYRAGVDVHDQLPPAAFSVSINVMESSDRVDRLDQYGFDLETKTISQVVNPIVAEPLFDILAYYGQDEDRELLRAIAGRHASDRLRMLAWQALARAPATPAAAVALLQEVPASAPALIREWAVRQQRRLAELADA